MFVAAGDIVRAGDPLAVVESMKMETTIAAPHDGMVSSVYAQVNTQVEAGAPLVALQAPAGRTESRAEWAWRERNGGRVRRPGDTVRGP